MDEKVGPKSATSILSFVITFQSYAMFVMSNCNYNVAVCNKVDYNNPKSDQVSEHFRNITSNKQLLMNFCH